MRGILDPIRKRRPVPYFVVMNPNAVTSWAGRENTEEEKTEVSLEGKIEDKKVEEKKGDSYKLTILHKTFPQVYEYSKQTKYGSTNRIMMMDYAFSNCQSVSFMNAQNLLILPLYEFKQLFILFWEKACNSRRQFVMDINRGHLAEMKKLFKPYMTKFVTKDYVSTNGSPMVICIIHLDKKAIGS